MYRPSHRFVPMLLVCLVCAAAVSSSAEVIGYSGRDTHVVELHLSAPGAAITEGRQWTPFVAEWVRAVELDSDGTLFVLTSNGLSAVRLYTMDLETGITTQVGTPGGILGRFDLAIDDFDRLWISTWDELYIYDIDTDTMETAVTVPAGGIGGIAWRQGELYVVLEPEDSESGPTLATLDPMTGTFTRSRELPGFASEGFYYRFQGVDFDAGGGLWIGTTLNNGLANPPVIPAIAYLDDPWNDEPEVRFLESAAATWSEVPLVVTGTLTAVAVPTASDISLAVLVTLLGALALIVLRRRDF